MEEAEELGLGRTFISNSYMATGSSRIACTRRCAACARGRSLWDTTESLSRCDDDLRRR